MFTAGTAKVMMEPAGANQRVTAIEDSAGLVDVIYKIHDRFEASFDPRTFCSLHISKHSEEGSRKRQTEIAFDYARGKSVLDEKNLKTGELKHLENDIPLCVTDLLSVFYYIAALPLQPGDTYTFPINDGGKTSAIAARVEAPEQVTVPAGTFRPDQRGDASVIMPILPKGVDAKAFGVTIEDDGGSQTPTMPIIIAGN